MQPGLNTTNLLPSLCSGVVQSLPLVYICDGDKCSVGKETLVNWREKRNASISHSPDALGAHMVVSDKQYTEEWNLKVNGFLKKEKAIT